MNRIRGVAAEATFKWEARLKNGKLAVFRLVKADGGGIPAPGYPHGFEVAGVNNRYHPQMAARLRSLVERGMYDEARALAVGYIASYQDAAGSWVSDQGVELFLRDSSFNRGPGGAAMILQMALNILFHGTPYTRSGLKIDGGVGPKTRAVIAAALPERAGPLVRALRTARERYERDEVGRNETSEFWKGLVNRWNDMTEIAMAYTGKED
jgi:lysozyme family protein